MSPPKMLDITVKTMDSQTRSFQVPEAETVGDFKRRISDSVNIPVANQRLIFQGRVLGDTATLGSDHHEKTLHLVQRPQAPAATTSSNSGASTTTTRPTATGPSNQNPHLMPTLNRENNREEIHVIMGRGRPSRSRTATVDILNQMFSSQGVFAAAAPVISGRLHQATGSGSDGAMNIEINLDDHRSFPDPRNSGSSSSGHQPTVAHARRAADARVSFERVWRILQELNNLINNFSSEESTLTTPASTASTIEVSLEPPSGGAGGESIGITTSSTRINLPDISVNNNEATNTSGIGPAPLSGSPSQTNLSSTAARTRLRQPLVSELRDFYSQFLQVQHRLDPIFSQYHRFLQQDPSFTSTNSREYQDASRFFSVAPQALRHVADIYDFLASVSIPLERVPPRPVIMNRPRRNNRQNSIPGVVGGVVRGNYPHGTPAPSGTNSAAAMARSAHPPAPGRRRFCVHQPARGQSGGSSSRNRGGNAGPSTTTTVPTGNTTTAQAANTPTANNGEQQQQVRSLPPYAFQINATVHPRVTVTVSPPSSGRSSSTTQNNQQQQQRRNQPNVQRMNFTWNGTNLTPSGENPQPSISMNAIHNLVANATQGNNQAGVVVVDSANMNNVGDDISRTITDTLYNSLSTYISQLTANPQQQQQQRPQQATATNTTAPQPRTTAEPVNNRNEVEENATTIDTTEPSPPFHSLGTAFMLLARDVIMCTESEEQLRQNPPLMLVDYMSANNISFPTDFSTSRDIIEMIAIQLAKYLSFSDLVLWYRNGRIPVDEIVTVVSHVILREVLGREEPETPEQIREALDRISPDLVKWLDKFFHSTDSAKSDCDIMETNFCFVIDYLERVLSEIYLNKDSSTNKEDLGKMLKDMILMFCQVNNNCFEGGDVFRKLVIEYLRGDSGEPINEEMFEFVLQKLLPSAEDAPESAAQYYRSKPQQSSDKNETTQAASSSSATTLSSSKTEVDDVTDDNITTSSASSSSTNANAPSNSGGDIEESNNGDWRMNIPAEWVKTLENDMNLQERMSYQPNSFSEAYMSGVPANKRRKMD